MSKIPYAVFRGHEGIIAYTLDHYGNKLSCLLTKLFTYVWQIIYLLCVIANPPRISQLNFNQT